MTAGEETSGGHLKTACLGVFVAHLSIVLRHLWCLSGYSFLLGCSQTLRNGVAARSAQESKLFRPGRSTPIGLNSASGWGSRPNETRSRPNETKWVERAWKSPRYARTRPDDVSSHVPMRRAFRRRLTLQSAQKCSSHKKHCRNTYKERMKAYYACSLYCQGRLWITPRLDRAEA